MKRPAQIELAVDDHASAEPRADEEARHVAVALRRAEAVLAEDAEVHVVADEKRHAEALLHVLADRVIAPREVRREEHDAALLIDDAGRAGCDGVQLLPVDAGVADHLLHDADDDLLDVRRAVAAGLRALFQAVDDLILLIKDGAEHLRAADVETDVVFL